MGSGLTLYLKHDDDDHATQVPQKDVNTPCNIEQCLHLPRLTTQVQDVTHDDCAFDTVMVLDGFLHLIHEHDDDEAFDFIVDHMGVCDINRCNIFRRHYRDRERIHWHENISVQQAIMDKIHCHYLHCYDVGHRLNREDRLYINEGIDTDQKNDDCVDFTSYTRRKKKKILLHIRKRAFKMHSNIGALLRRKTSRYVDQVESGMNRGITFKFVYDPSDGDVRYEIETLCVRQKYASWKEELLCNCILPLNQQQWHHAYDKAMVYYDSFYRKHKYPEMSVEQLLSLMIFCNFDQLRYEFSKTYPKMDMNETDWDIVERHANFYFLGKNLQQCTNIAHKASKSNQYLYHGVSGKVVYPLYFRNRGPLSTTSSLPFACQFTDNGMILEVDQTHWMQKNVGLPVAWLSDYSDEKQYLFVQCNAEFRIHNIIDSNSCVEYGIILKALTIIDGKVNLFDKVDATIRILAQKIIRQRLSITLPEYYQPFRSLDLYSDEMIRRFFEAKTYFEMTYGNKVFEALHHKSYDRMIRVPLIQHLFPKIERIHIREIDLCSFFLEQIPRLKSIKSIVIKPMNKSELSMDQAIEKYQVAFKMRGIILSKRTMFSNECFVISNMDSTKQTQQDWNDNPQAAKNEATQIVHKAISSAKQLIRVAGSWTKQREFEKYLSGTHTNNITSCPLRNNYENNASPSASDDSGENKEQQSDKSHDNNYNDDNDANHHHNDDRDEKQQKENRNDMHHDENCYHCNVVWHEAYIKQLESENDRFRKLLKTNAIRFEEIEPVDELKLDPEILGDCNASTGSKEMAPPNASVHVTISKKLTNTEIPKKKIQETYSNVANYMNHYIGIHADDAIKTYPHKETIIQVRDYDFHCKETKESLYVICTQSPSDLSWSMKPKLCTAVKIKDEFGICINDLPRASLQKTISLEIENALEQIKSILVKVKERNNFINSKKIPWHRADKIPIYNKAHCKQLRRRSTSSQFGITLRLTKQQFVNTIEQFVDEKKDNIYLIPMIRCDEYEYNVYIAWMVEIEKNRNIAIALQLDKNDKLKVKGIYLDIHDEHKLAHWDCDGSCLAEFKCDIDRLAIGETQEKRMYQSKLNKRIDEYNQIINRITNPWKQKCDKQAKEYNQLRNEYDKQSDECNRIQNQYNEQLDEYDQLRNQFDEMLNEYRGLRKKDEEVIENMIRTCDNLQLDLADTQLWITSLSQQQLRLDEQQNQSQERLNYLHQHQLVLRSYNNQLIGNQVNNVDDTNNDNDNEHQ